MNSEILAIVVWNVCCVIKRNVGITEIVYS